MNQYKKKLDEIHKKLKEIEDEILGTKMTIQEDNYLIDTTSERFRMVQVMNRHPNQEVTYRVYPSIQDGDAQPNYTCRCGNDYAKGTVRRSRANINQALIMCRSCKVGTMIELRRGVLEHPTGMKTSLTNYPVYDATYEAVRQMLISGEPLGPSIRDMAKSDSYLKYWVDKPAHLKKYGTLILSGESTLDDYEEGDYLAEHSL